MFGSLWDIWNNIFNVENPVALECRKGPDLPLKMRYLIGADDVGEGEEDTITVVPLDFNGMAANGISAGYCSSPGWDRNLKDQFERRRSHGFKYIELDSADSCAVTCDILPALDLAATFGLKVIAKNPMITNNPVAYLSHQNIVGAIVENGAGTPGGMQTLRVRAGKPGLPVWFVSFGDGLPWGTWAVGNIRVCQYKNMSASYSAVGEYRRSEQL